MSMSASPLVLELTLVVEVVEGEETVNCFVEYEVLVLGDVSVFSSTAAFSTMAVSALAAVDEPQKSAPVPH
jgi:hypothetical protein